MSVFKSQFTRALKVIPSNYCNIPSPSGFIVHSVATDNCSGNLMTDNSVDFISLNVQPGDIVYCYPSDFAATVVSVVDSYTLELNNCGISSGDGYDLYQGPVSGLGNTGAYLISDIDTTATIVTIGGDEVVIKLTPNVNCGLQILKVVTVTGGANITALW